MKSSEVKIFSVILVFAIILVGLALTPMILQNKARQAMSKPRERPTVTREMLETPGSPAKGDPKAPTTLVIFSDFQCPSCREGVPVVEEIMQSKKGKVREVFHHFQVKPEHTYSQILSRAAEAAGAQGKFWPMHDILFNKQKDLVASGNEEQVLFQIRDYAKSLGLDMMAFDAAMAKKDDSRFKKDMDLGIKLDLSGTPTYFVIDPAGKVKQYNTTAALKDWAYSADDKSGKS